MKKALISLSLALAMCLSLCVPAFAVDGKGYGNVTLEYEDIKNGDTCFYLVKNDQRIAEAYVDRSSNSVIHRDYVSGEVTKQEYQPVERRSPYTAKGSRYIHLGSIKYNYYSPHFEEPQGTHSINCGYSRTVANHKPFEVNGTFEDITTLAGFIVAVAGLPGLVASKIAGVIVSILGVGIGASGLLVDDCLVDTCATTMLWKLSDRFSSSNDTSMEGCMYNYSINRESGTSYTGDYWSANSFGNHDYDFAYHIYTLLYGTGRSSVISWN